MRIYFDTVGCRLNQSEIELLARQFRAAGHLIADSAAEADLVVINTCTVTSAAASDSRQKIRQAARAGGASIAVTGCWATLEPEAARRLPNVDWVIPNSEKHHLTSTVLGMPVEEFDLEPLARQPLPGLHQRTRAFIKVQDGCDNFCTFCITRLARGKGRSQSINEVVGEVRAAVSGGAREVVLSGVHLGSWGKDFPMPLHLRHLIEAILMDTDVERVRLSSLEPWDLDEAFFRLWQNPRMCRHLHLPLQSGSAATLKRMVRKTTPTAFARLLESARAICPEMAITTDIIVGFPGESESEFEESLAFVQQMNFAGGHVFSFSKREGTAAARMKGTLHGSVIRERNARMREVLRQSSLTYRQKFLGSLAGVLWESCDEVGRQGWRLHGLTDHYIRVEACSPQPLWNQISRVRLVQVTDEGMHGEILDVGE
ncbi:MAG: tRNA (N(6)-L-threonylcarbamoyladenosine(37)-C(2))-methylthiotransferase MtaB [Bellilinea sp.]|nr:MAG: tRNA (N(6)-L-threonylcarbamoyladenosine(37)-C(2))-methylthiotransferase MtaB [Bellilinea sp.]